MLQRCDQCNGRKKIIGLGGMQKDCPSCKGIGHITIKPKLECIEEEKPRRGRPVKEINSEIEV